ncbi:Ribonuclease H-like domain containing protein [Amanita muscaria]
MGRGERDKADPNLIVDGSRRPHPSKRVQGLDYPQTVTKLKTANKGNEGVDAENVAEHSKDRENLVNRKKALRIDTFFVKNTSTRPQAVGEALNADGTLKDASEIEWLHSPSEMEGTVSLKRMPDNEEVEDGGESDSMGTIRQPKPKRQKKQASVSTQNLDSVESVANKVATVADDLVLENEEKTNEDLSNEESENGESDGEQEDVPYTPEEEEARNKFLLVLKNSKVKQTATATSKVHQTRDIRLCYREGTRIIGDEEIAGYFCTFCLNGKPSKGPQGWCTGNVTSRRRHLARKHYEAYVTVCKSNGINPKEGPPEGWKPSKGFKQRNISEFAVKATKLPKVTKDGIREYLLELIVDCDLPFQFADRSSLRRLLMYINPKLVNTDIPHKSTIAMAVDEKVKKLDEIDRKLLQLLCLVGDNVTTNDVSVRYVCKVLDPPRKELVPSEVRGRCINHAINLAAAWFIKGLGIPSAAKVKHAIHGKQYEAADSTDDGDDGQEESDEDDVADEEFDVDVNPDLEANADDEDAMLGTTITDFEPGDVVGKVMAFVNQVRASSEPTRDFLKQLCLTNGCKPCDLKLWVKTRWGSLSDCFEVALGMRRAIDDFCVLTDGRSNIPPLRKPKHWKDFRLSQDEWTIVELAYECLKVPASMHSQLSAEKTPTCHKVYPLIIQLIAEWEEYQDDPEYDLVKHALKVGLANIKKWYQTTKGSLMYFITHVLDPTRKLTFLEAAWEEDTLKAAKKNFEKIVRSLAIRVPSGLLKLQASDAAGMDNFMDQFIKKKKPILAIPTSVGYENVNPLEEFKRYFARPCLGGVIKGLNTLCFS